MNEPIDIGEMTKNFLEGRQLSDNGIPKKTVKVLIEEIKQQVIDETNSHVRRIERKRRLKEWQSNRKNFIFNKKNKKRSKNYE